MKVKSCTSPCFPVPMKVRNEGTQEEKCAALFALQACLTHNQGCLLDRELFTGKSANPKRIEMVQDRLDNTSRRILELNCKKS
ncbi:MAG: hypothetical protein V4489_09070 [Chlamydiota bacterium]